MPTVLRRAVRCLLEREPCWVETGLAVTTVFWAVATYASVAELRAWPSMRVLLELGGERFWPLLGLGLGVSQAACVLADRRWARWVVAMAQGWFWGVLTLGAWAAAPGCLVAALYAGWCGASAVSTARLLRPLLPSDWPLVE